MKTKFVNESISDFLEPKSKEYIINDLKKLPQQKLNTKLLNAAKDGNIEVVKLLDTGADINNRSKGIRYTPLIIATINNKKDMVEFLLDHGAEVNLQDEAGWPAIWYALKNRKQNIVKLLRKYGGSKW